MNYETAITILTTRFPDAKPRSLRRDAHRAERGLPAYLCRAHKPIDRGLLEFPDSSFKQTIVIPPKPGTPEVFLPGIPHWNIES